MTLPDILLHGQTKPKWSSKITHAMAEFFSILNLCVGRDYYILKSNNLRPTRRRALTPDEQEA